MGQACLCWLIQYHCVGRFSPEQESTDPGGGLGMNFNLLTLQLFIQWMSCPTASGPAALGAPVLWPVRNHALSSGDSFGSKRQGLTCLGSKAAAEGGPGASLLAAVGSLL